MSIRGCLIPFIIIIWLVGCFGRLRSFETVFQSISGRLPKIGWCDGKFPVPGRPTIWITVGQGPTALAVGAGGGCLDIFLSSILSLLFLPLFGRRPDID